MWSLKILKNFNDMGKYLYLLTMAIFMLNKYKAGNSEHCYELKYVKNKYKYSYTQRKKPRRKYTKLSIK